MKKYFAPTVLFTLCSITLGACGGQSAVIGEREPGIDNQSVGDRQPDAGGGLQSGPPEALAPDAGEPNDPADDPPSSESPPAPSDSSAEDETPAPTDTASSGSVSTPGPESTASSMPSADPPSSAPSHDEPFTLPSEPCADSTPIDLPAATVAERVAQLILQGPPDQELLDAAEEGHLNTLGEVQCQARRLAALPDSKLGVAALLESWLAFDSLPAEPRTELAPEVWSQMNVEALDYIQSVSAAESSDLAALLRGTEGLVGPELAAHYGVEFPDGESSARLEIPSRVGVLSLGRWTAGLGRIGQRGAWILRHFECTDPGAPSADTAIIPSMGSTYRENYESSVSAATCQGCHQLIDGPGFALQAFAADGRYVTEESGQPMDVSGYYSERSEDGTISKIEVSGAGELAAELLESPAVGRCAAQQALAYAGPFSVSTSTAADTELVSAYFEASDRDFRELLVAVTQTQQFWATEGD